MHLKLGAENEKTCDQNDTEANIEVAKVEEKEDNAPPDAFFTVHLLFFFLGLLHFIPTSFFNVATKVHEQINKSTIISLIYL